MEKLKTPSLTPSELPVMSRSCFVNRTILIIFFKVVTYVTYVSYPPAIERHILIWQNFS